MTIDIENLPPDAQFAYITMTKTAISFKEKGMDKNFFLYFSEEIWNSMELSDLEHLKNVLEEKMQKDLLPYLNR